MNASIFDKDLQRRAANYQPLSPLTFLERAADVFPDRVAVVHGAARLTYRALRSRAHQLASALAARGIGRGDTVAVVLANTPPMIECHYGVPMCGAVLNTINTRLDPATIAYILDHGEAKALIVDRELSPVVTAALALARTRPLLIGYEDPTIAVADEAFGTLDYEALIAEGDPAYGAGFPKDEWDAISLNYTSGTTSRPKGVVYHHRGAYLLALGNVVTCAMPKHAVYLWTLPMFHCNGWCFPWSVAVVAGTQVCLRAVRGEPILKAVADHRVTHMSGAPIVMSVILEAAARTSLPPGAPVAFLTAAAPPPETVLGAMRAAGFAVTHLYGLTETYGPAVVNDWNDDWNALPPAAWAARQARQGVRYVPLEGLDVIDPHTMEPVAADGKSLGEVMFRGNVVMKGYLKDAQATEAAFSDGWFHSGALGVKHPDGYIQLKDRAKDIIISGGENVSSIEVEEALSKHPAVQGVAVVAKADAKWGEVPCAFVECRAGQTVSEAELIAWCRGLLAGFKSPKMIVFSELPRTSTGKIQKFILRERAKHPSAQETSA